MSKIFVVSLHRCAGQSVELFLGNAGLRTCHWPAIVEGTDYQAKIIGSETAPTKIVKLLRPVFDVFDAVGDVPLPALYRELDKAYPDARFVAIYRNPFDWVRSARRHCQDRDLDAYERAQYWRYLADRPRRLDQVADDRLVRMFWRHYGELSAYFAGRDDFLLLDLGDPQLGERLAAFVGVAPAEFPRFDYKDATSHRAENTLATLQHRLASAEAALAAVEAAHRGALREYADLTQNAEAAQRWLVEVLAAELVGQPRLSPVPDDWPDAGDDASALHRTIVARMIAAVERANRLGMAFHVRADGWRGERAGLTERLRDGRRALERAVGERDRARTAGPPLAAHRATPLVSIVLPVYNQAYLVAEAIAGVLAQTYPHWELIVVDDGSTDDLESRLQEHLDERRVLLLRQPNQRLPAALDHGFAHARGELWTWTSADNIMLPSQLERLVEELTSHPEAGLVYSDYWAIDDKGEPLADPYWRGGNRDAEFPDLIRLPAAVTVENFHRSRDNFIGPSFMYRRSVAEIVGRYVDDAFGGEDYDFWLRMHLATEFRHVAEPLYKYRVHADTLTARAAELGLHANIAEVVEAARWRIDTLLADGALSAGGSLLRPVSQFHSAILKRCKPLPYRDFATDAAIADTPAVVDVDVPLRSIDAARLRHADILLCRSALAAALLRREAWANGKRILLWNGGLVPAVQHAFIQAFAERAAAPLTAGVVRRPARIDDRFQPSRILLVVERWSSGGLENVVVDLAGALAARGRTVTVASAHGGPPPAAALADPGIRTLSFRGSESAFAAFLDQEAIEAVNYHHSRFGARRAARRAVATIYTMHNCYLWMDDAARGEVAAGLAEMDRLIAVSRQVAQFAAAQFGVPVERIEVVPNGLRDDIAQLAASAGRPMLSDGSPFTVAMVGSFTRLKLQHVAIAAFDAVADDIPAMRLRLIGALSEPAYAEELAAQIAASPCADRIELTVGLSRRETVTALAGAHVLLLPSLIEGCSMALLEAAAAGCVCIASDVGSACELAIDGGAVVLLPAPLGEPEGVTQQQFFAAAVAELPEHGANIADALRRVRRDYGSFAAAAAQTRALGDGATMQRMTDAYLAAYTAARRGGPEHPAVRPEAEEAEVLAAAD